MCPCTSTPTCVGRFVVQKPPARPAIYSTISPKTGMHCPFDIPIAFLMISIPCPHQPAFWYFLHNPPRPPQTPAASSLVIENPRQHTFGFHLNMTRQRDL